MLIPTWVNSVASYFYPSLFVSTGSYDSFLIIVLDIVGGGISKTAGKVEEVCVLGI